MAAESQVRTGRAAGEATRLPRGRGALPAAEVSQIQRHRLLRAVTAVVGRKGYPEASVAQIHLHARVSRKTFYEHFTDREDCFLAAYDTVVSELLARITDTVLNTPGGWLARIDAGQRVYLRFIAEDPVRARAFLLEIPAAGAKGLAAQRAVLDRFADMLRALYEQARVEDGAPELPDYVFPAIVGAISELVTRHLLAESASSLEQLAQAVLDIEVSLLRLPPGEAEAATKSSNVTRLGVGTRLG